MKYFVVLNSPNGYVDKGFQQAGVSGICDYLKIPVDKTNQCNRQNAIFAKKAAFGFPNTFIDPKKIYIYIKNQTAKNPNKHNVFILPGFAYSAFLSNYLNKFNPKNTSFISIDTYFSPKPNSAWPKNLFQYSFNQQYSGYNAGLYVAIQALLYPEKFKDGDLKKPGKQIKFAAIGGIKIPAISAYAFGFKAAIQTIHENREVILELIKSSSDKNLKTLLKNKKIDPKQKVDLIFEKVSIIGGFDPQTKSDETRFLTKELFDKHRVSAVFSIAVSLTFTMQRVAKEQNFIDKLKQNWIVGVDSDQAFSLADEVGPVTQDKSDSVFLVSATINLRRLVNNILEKINNKKPATKSEKIGSFEMNKDLIQIPSRYRNNKNLVWVVLEKLANKKIPQKSGKLSIEVTKNLDDLFVKELISKSFDSKFVGFNPIWNFLNSPKKNLKNFKLEYRNLLK